MVKKGIPKAEELPPTDAESDEATPRCMVAMPFQQKWSPAVFSAIEQVMRSVKVDVFKVDTTQRLSVKLAEDVEKQIRAADLMVADVTGQNPNVHIEIGLALANRKPILLCAQRDQDICAHLRDHLYVKYHTTDAGLRELSRQLRLRMQDVLQTAHLEQEAARLKMQLETRYSVECFRDRSVADLGEAFASARRRIDILTTNLRWLFDEAEDLRSSYWESIKSAIDRTSGLQLRILTLNPQSEIAAARGRQLGFDPGNFRDQLQHAYEDVRNVASSYPTSRVEVRLYDELPTQITFRIDQKVYTCIVGQPMQSRNYPVLKFDVANLGVKEAFLSHFLEIWKGAIQ